MKYQIAGLSGGPFGDIFDNMEDAEAALEIAARWDKDAKQDVAPASTQTPDGHPEQEKKKLTYKPKPPRRVTLAAKVEPRVRAWLKKQFPESVSHGVNHILAEYMAKHAKGVNHAND